MSATEMSLRVSGHCGHCSWRERYVFHGVPWCPKEPALGWVDWNAGDRCGAPGGRDRVTHHIMAKHLSRPVKLGERLLIQSDDGGLMATWAEVIAEYESGSVGVVECGVQGPDPDIAYADSGPRAAPLDTYPRREQP